MDYSTLIVHCSTYLAFTMGLSVGLLFWWWVLK